LTRPEIHTLRHAYRMLFSGEGTILQTVEKVATEFPKDKNVQLIVQFVREAGKRRLTTPRASRNEDISD